MSDSDSTWTEEENVDNQDNAALGDALSSLEEQLQEHQVEDDSPALDDALDNALDNAFPTDEEFEAVPAPEAVEEAADEAADAVEDADAGEIEASTESFEDYPSYDDEATEMVSEELAEAAEHSELDASVSADETHVEEELVETGLAMEAPVEDDMELAHSADELAVANDGAGETPEEEQATAAAESDTSIAEAASGASFVGQDAPTGDFNLTTLTQLVDEIRQESQRVTEMKESVNKALTLIQEMSESLQS